MSIKKLTLAACAVAATLASVNANALTRDAVDPENPTASDLVIHYAGSTAQEQAVKDLAADYCADTPDQYSNAVGPTALIITCTLKSAAPVPASIQGKNLYFSYYEDGGSIYGVTPVIGQIPLNYMKIYGNTTCSGSSPTFTCDNDVAHEYSHTPDGGGSDVEPALFKGSNVAGLAFSAPQGSNFTAFQAFNVIFGLAVNCALLDHSVYTGCQAANGGPGGAGGPLKSLSKASATSIFDGSTIFWEEVPEYAQADDGSGTGKTYADDFLAGTSATPIHICRRKPGSGTQASAQAYFENQECGGPARPFVTAATAAIPGEVEEIESSSHILTDCVDINTAGIAISGVEKGPRASWGNNWDYININGIAPTEANAATGKYDYMFENSMQYYNGASPGALAFLNAMFSGAKKASTLAGKPGVLAIPDFALNNIPGDPGDSNGNGTDFDFVASNPVSWWTRNGLACKPGHQVYP